MSPARTPTRIGVPTPPLTSGVSSTRGGAFSCYAAHHRAALREHCVDHAIESIFKSSELSDGLLRRGHHDFVGRTLRDDASRVEKDYPFAESKHFFSTVRDVENRDTMSPIPFAQIVDDVRLCRGIERRQGLIEQENVGIRDQSSGQSGALAFSS